MRHHLSAQAIETGTGSGKPAREDLIHFLRAFYLHTVTISPMRLPDDKLSSGTEAGDCSASALIRAAHDALDRGDPAEAGKLCDRAIRLDPSDPSAHRLSAEISAHEGRFHDAETTALKAVELDPADAESHFLLGWARQLSGKLEEAAAAYKHAIDLNPSHTAASYNLGLVLEELGRVGEAIEALERAVSLTPSDPRARFTVGRILHEHKRHVDAAAHLLESVRLEPNNPRALFQLGKLLNRFSQFQRAEGLLVRAAEFGRNDAEILHALGVAYSGQFKTEDAFAAFHEALDHDANHSRALNRFILQTRMLCQWDGLADAESRLERYVVAQKGVQPLQVTTVLSSAAEVALAAGTYFQRRYARSRYHALKNIDFQFGARNRTRIRVGYLSADFRETVVARLICEVFARHDRDRFEVFGYSIGPDDRSGSRERIAQGFDRFVDVREMSFDEAARTIHRDGVDILIDLGGYTRDHRFDITALRPAPIQVNYLGYPGTLGADVVDYIIADEYLIPEHLRRYYSEHPVYLPDCYQVNPSERPRSETAPTRADMGLPEEGFVFCAFGRLFKLGPDLFDVWMRLLREVPDSVLWIVPLFDRTEQNIRREAAARAVDPERIVCSGKVQYPEYLRRLELADLFLDTMPYNSGGVAADALWAGLPVLTCSGETYVSRMAGSLVRAAGAPELITTDVPEYEQRALDLARDRDALTRIRKKLAENRRTGPLFDCERFTRHLERAFEEMWRIYSAGESPRSFAVAPLPRDEPL